MADKNTTNLAAAIINDRRYSELKTSIYEDLVNKDHATVVAVFKTLQDYAIDAEDNSFHAGEKPAMITSKVGGHDLEIDPDLDDALTPEEVSLRK
jgi:hypothetical protein